MQDGDSPEAPATVSDVDRLGGSEILNACRASFPHVKMMTGISRIDKWRLHSLEPSYWVIFFFLVVSVCITPAFAGVTPCAKAVENEMAARAIMQHNFFITCVFLVDY